LIRQLERGCSIEVLNERDYQFGSVDNVRRYCFGIYTAPAQLSLIAHGELFVSKVTAAVTLVWQAGGRDIFTGPMSVERTAVRAEDFNGDWYVFGLDTGSEIARSF
jgi:hypothetical protein